MNIEWIQSFSEAAKQKSFSKAAKQNNLSQPALSKHIQNLENNLDVVLFHRTSTGIELTEAGEHFYNRIKPVLAEFTAIRQELQRFSQNKPIAIGSLPSIATYYLPSRLKGLRLMDRTITLRIENTSGELLQALQEGRLDAVLVDTLYTGEALWSCELFTEHYYAVCPLGHRFQSKKSVELAELCDEPFIVHQAPCDTRKHIVEQIELLGRKPTIISEVAFGDFILGAVTAGMGITIIPELTAKNIGHLDLFALPIVNFGRKRTVSLVTQNHKLGLKLKEFLLAGEEEKRD
ncbi:LysR family transcriptional regulator [Bacillus xiapuensis]|uniref:LysR family transcriptional regulator n=1 Tax=Bacillus xiapuensis TaxID=2014075 RepID=UPI000C231425|nr:LysR family transcriptional regulator [Bacillus xiapuensis]